MLPDLLVPNLLAVFVGTSVSTTSAARKHYYAHPSNRFWELLDATGLTGDARLTSSRDREIIEYGIGLTDLVKGRAASADDLLRSGDYDVPGFIGRVESVSPLTIAFNGGEAARRVARYLGMPVVLDGPTGWCVGAAPAYVLPSSSAMNTSVTLATKRDRWQAFGSWVRTRQSS